MVWDRPEDVHAPAFRLRRREARGGCRLRLRKQPQYIDRVRIIGMNIPGIAYNADGLVPCIVQKLVELRYDCDADTLLALVHPAGPACHTGERTCFYRAFPR